MKKWKKEVNTFCYGFICQRVKVIMNKIYSKSFKTINNSSRYENKYAVSNLTNMHIENGFSKYWHTRK